MTVAPWLSTIPRQPVTTPASRPFVRQMFTLPNNPFGWLLLALLKHYANRHSYRIVLRGRGTRWWVRWHDRVCRRHNAQRNAAYRALSEDQKRVAPFKGTWRVWAGGQSIRVRYATRLGVYLDRRACTTERTRYS